MDETEILTRIAVCYTVLVTVASHLVEILPTPDEITSPRYLIFYNTIRRIARSKPWKVERKGKAITAAKQAVDVAKEKVAIVETINDQEKEK